jgi:hypothetical protein
VDGGRLRPPPLLNRPQLKLGVRQHPTFEARYESTVGGPKLHVSLDAERFAPTKPIVVSEASSELRFEIESDQRRRAPHAPAVARWDEHEVRVAGQVISAITKYRADVVVESPVSGASTNVCIDAHHS